ncbi:MAG: zinc-dependent peptidase, partial [Gemmatimonadota bacterium]|nr:zinc-dependent peptidase [Gemmatimonadota bacterium]
VKYFHSIFSPGEPVFVALFAVLLLGGLFFFAARFSLGSVAGPVKFSRLPIPNAWPDLVRRKVPLSRRLAPHHFERLLRYTQVFLEDKHIEGCGGMVITEEIRVTIAAQACLLLLGRELGCYQNLRTVLVYPSAYISSSGRNGWFEEDWENDEEQVSEGESWDRNVGVVVLAWESALEGTSNRYDGENVIIHEFAHQLDQMDGITDGVVRYSDNAESAMWTDVMQKNLELLRRNVERGKDTVLDEYGTTNEAEFFAVASEVFFQMPDRLLSEYPDLYSMLKEIYNLDPVKPTMLD